MTRAPVWSTRTAARGTSPISGSATGRSSRLWVASTRHSPSRPSPAVRRTGSRRWQRAASSKSFSSSMPSRATGQTADEQPPRHKDTRGGRGGPDGEGADGRGSSGRRVRFEQLEAAQCHDAPEMSELVRYELLRERQEYRFLVCDVVQHY